MLMMLTLFTNFYIHAYIIRRRKDHRNVGQGDSYRVDHLSSIDSSNGVIAADNFGFAGDKKMA